MTTGSTLPISFASHLPSYFTPSKPKPSALNKIFTLAPEGLRSSHAKYATIWTVAKVVCIIAPFAIIAASYPIAMMAAWNPENIFLFTTACAAGLQIFSSAFSLSRERASFNNKEAAKYARITQIHTQLKEKAGLQVRSDFEQHGLPSNKIEKFENLEWGYTHLTLGFAHLMHANERTTKLDAKAKKLSDQLQKSIDIEERRIFSYKLIKTSQKRAFSRIQAAYYFGLLRNPFCSKELSNIGTFQERHPYHLILDNCFGPESGSKPFDQYFTFNAKGQDPILGKHLEKSLKTFEENPQNSAASLKKIAKKLFRTPPTA